MLLLLLLLLLPRLQLPGRTHIEVWGCPCIARCSIRCDRHELDLFGNRPHSTIGGRHFIVHLVMKHGEQLWAIVAIVVILGATVARGSVASRPEERDYEETPVQL